MRSPLREGGAQPEELVSALHGVGCAHWCAGSHSRWAGGCAFWKASPARTGSQGASLLHTASPEGRLSHLVAEFQEDRSGSC